MQIARLEQNAAANEQGSSTHCCICSATDTLEPVTSANARQLTTLLQQVAQALQKYKPQELRSAALVRCPLAEQAEQLLASVEPQLKGDLINILDAMDQFRLFRDLNVTDLELATAVEEADVLKESCLSRQEPIFRGLLTHVEAACNSLRSWLDDADRRMAEYEQKAAEVLRLQDRAALCARAHKMIRAP